MSFLVFPNKQLRAEILAAYIRSAGYEGCVCFSCGNAAKALRETGVNTLEISSHGPLIANCWWLPEEIHRVWPHLFDATSGHLPAFLMVRMAQRFRTHLGELNADTVYEVPTGSGETIVCLRWAYPYVRFTPVRNLGPETHYEPLAPLNLPAGN